jgi:hypothetical protein
MEPRQRGQVRGSTLFIEAVLSEPAEGHQCPCPRADQHAGSPNHDAFEAYGVSCRVRAERPPGRLRRLHPISRPGEKLVPPPHGAPPDLRALGRRCPDAPAMGSVESTGPICDFVNIVRPKRGTVNSSLRLKCVFGKPRSGEYAKIGTSVPQRCYRINQSRHTAARPTRPSLMPPMRSRRARAHRAPCCAP